MSAQRFDLSSPHARARPLRLAVPFAALMAAAAMLAAGGIAAAGVPIPITISAEGPTVPVTGVCPDECIDVIDITINDANDPGPHIRAVSVSFQLDGMVLCDEGPNALIVEGGYLAGGGATTMQTYTDGAGLYTVDIGILGTPCGVGPPSSGTLFTVKVRPTATTGSATFTVTSALVRSCLNATLAHDIVDGVVSILIDDVPPGVVAITQVLQDKTNNGDDGTTFIDLAFTAPADDDFKDVELWRKGFGGYPQYTGAGPTPPVTYPPGAGWELASTVPGPGPALTDSDEPETRDFWYYVAYARDNCDNVSAPSEMSEGTLNYHLGDVAAPPPTTKLPTGGASLGTACAGDNEVDDLDISALGFHYGCGVSTNSNCNSESACLDVGPTTNGSVDARPIPDGKVEFEDLMMFIINHGEVSAPQSAPARIAAGYNTLDLRVPPMPAVGDELEVVLAADASGNLQGLSARLDYNHAILEFLGVQAGPLLEQQGAPGHVLSSEAGVVDVVVVGPGSTIQGNGDLAFARFRVLAAGDPQIGLASVIGRDIANQDVPVNSGVVDVGTDLPTTTQLAPAAPNPFDRLTRLTYTLARPGRVDLVVYGVDGRRIRTLVSETREAGAYHCEWNGRDDAGRSLHAGVYFVRMTTEEGRQSRALVLR